ncbi:MAG: nucleotidyl transferase AbiEii/AbiGii toxin family protein [Candidatus Altiarchaeota archaeon]
MKITKELVDYVAGKTGVKETVLVEKDMYLHLLLKELSSDEHFRTHYVFKGGTCLTKCYLGYYRFSEDLDFSYIRQEEFEGKSEKQIRKQLSEEISGLAKKLELMSAKLGLEFKADKKDRQYMEFGGGNKFTTFKVWYESVELKARQFVKIQVNYVEKFKYPFKTLEAKNNLGAIDIREFKYLYPDAAEELLHQPTLKAYDIREILAEKVRAILTRKGTKARDFIDVYLIQKHAHIKIEDIENQIIDKTKFMLKYGKYRQNLLEKKDVAPSFKPGGEERLVIKPLDAGFLAYTQNFNKTLGKIISKINENGR